MDGIEASSSDEDECDCAECALASGQTRASGDRDYSDSENVSRPMVPPGLIHALPLRARSGRSGQRLIFQQWANPVNK